MAHSLKIASEFSDGDRSKISSKNAARYMQSLVAPMQYDEHRANQKQNRFAMMDAAEKTHAQEDAINTDNARLLKESEVAVKKLGSELGMNG